MRPPFHPPLATLVHGFFSGREADMAGRAVLTWLLMVPVAVLNGLVRESVVRPRIGELRAHQVSVVTGSTGFLALVYALWRDDVADVQDRDLVRMGAWWVVATIIFEFGFGRFLRGFSWRALLHDYNVREGRLWIVVLLVMLFSPVVTKRVATPRRGTVVSRRPVPGVSGAGRP